MFLPRLAHNVSRPRISTWLARNERTPLRLLVAPAGSGKTTAVVSYLRSRGLPYAYCVGAPNTTPAQFITEICEALELAPESSYDALLAALSRSGELLLAVEHIDAAAPPVLALLARLVEEAPENIGLLYTARSWDALDIERIAPQGLAAVCDDRMIAFDAAEIGRLADVLGVMFTPEDAQRLAHLSEGFAIVAAGAVRNAAEQGVSLANAYGRWHESQAHLFSRFVDAAADSLADADLALWKRLCATGLPNTPADLAHLRNKGMFVWRDAHGNHYPYRAVEHLFSQSAPTGNVAPLEAPPLVVKLLGNFDAAIANEPVSWIRRRDQQIFLYLLLKEDGSASRTELCENFWPDAEPELRAASLRVACSNIRRAIGNIVGAARVDRYFRSDGDIGVNFANVIVDARRFRAHCADGDEQFALENHADAIVHYGLAEKLYGGRLGWCASVDQWVQRQGDVFEALYLRVLERLIALHRRAEDAPRAYEFAQKLAAASLPAAETSAAC